MALAPSLTIYAVKPPGFKKLYDTSYQKPITFDTINRFLYIININVPKNKKHLSSIASFLLCIVL